MPKIGKNGRTETKCHAKKAIDWDIVKKLCYMQSTVREICGFIEISEDAMLDACKENWDMTPSEKFADWYEGGKCSLRRKQWILADTSAAVVIFLGKQILKQTDDHVLNHKGDMNYVIQHFGDNDAKQWQNDDKSE